MAGGRLQPPPRRVSPAPAQASLPASAAAAGATSRAAGPEHLTPGGVLLPPTGMLPPGQQRPPLPSPPRAVFPVLPLPGAPAPSWPTGDGVYDIHDEEIYDIHAEEARAAASAEDDRLTNGFIAGMPLGFAVAPQVEVNRHP